MGLSIWTTFLLMLLYIHCVFFVLCSCLCLIHFVCILRFCAGVVFEIATHSPLHSFVCLFFSPLSAFQWRKGLKLSGEAAVEQITLDGVRGLRVMLSATVHDVLYYMSPVYCQDIINAVWVIPKNLWNSLSFHFPFLFLFDVSTHCSSLSVFSSIETVSIDFQELNFSYCLIWTPNIERSAEYIICTSVWMSTLRRCYIDIFYLKLLLSRAIWEAFLGCFPHIFPSSRFSTEVSRIVLLHLLEAYFFIENFTTKEVAKWKGFFCKRIKIGLSKTMIYGIHVQEPQAMKDHESPYPCRANWG